MTTKPKMTALSAVNLLQIQSLKMEVRGLEKALKNERTRIEALQADNQRLREQLELQERKHLLPKKKNTNASRFLKST